MGRVAGNKWRKAHRGKYRYGRSKKNEITSKLKQKIPCDIIADAWDSNKTGEQNLAEMGLVYNLSKAMKPKEIHILAPKDGDVTTTPKVSKKKKNNVANKLEEQAESKKGKHFRLPKDKVRWITYMMDKYGDDYKAMARDPKNYFQDTWKQIRAKARQFQNIPEQYAPYLKEKGLLTNEYIENQKQETKTYESDGEFD